MVKAKKAKKGKKANSKPMASAVTKSKPKVCEFC